DPSHEEALSVIASVARGSIYVAAEQLLTDPELTEVDQLYREVGLRRSRRVWLAYREYKDEPIGAVIAYRGPLGLNFSYIENRCSSGPKARDRRSPRRSVHPCTPGVTG